MKRDLDLARQLLIDIENRGTDCSVSVLRSGANHQTEEQARYHLRLLIDANLLKEIDRTSAGIPCVRLTHEGHELLELARSESRWREAKYACQQRLGGLSLTVIRGILLRWAVAATSRGPRYQRVAEQRAPLDRAPIGRRMRYETDPPRAAYRVEPYRSNERVIDREYWDDDARYASRPHEPVRYENGRYDDSCYENVRYVPVRAEADDHAPRYSRYGLDLDGDGLVDLEFDASSNGYLI